MSESTNCPACGASLEIRPVEAACPDCVQRFERWCAEVARIAGERAGFAQANPLTGGEHEPVLLQVCQQWFNDGLTPEQAAAKEIDLLRDLRSGPGEPTKG